MKHLRQYPVFVISALVIFFIGYAWYSGWLLSEENTQNQLNSVLQRDEQSVFEPVLPDTVVTLPEDFRFHPEYQHEWWHFFANVQDAQGKEYSVQWSYFRMATDERITYGWKSPQLYIANVVVTDQKKVYKEQRLARGGIGQAGASNSPFRVWIDNWNWRSLGQTPFPGSLNVATDDFAVDLLTRTRGPFVLNGERGYQVKHDLESIASFSFSAPFLSVAGNLTLDGKIIPVRGKAWLQKEWGSGLIGDGQNGWDWFVVNLDDGRALSISQYRHHSRLPYLFGTLSTRSGKVINLTEDDIVLKPMNLVSLDNGRRIPLQWSIHLPQHNIQLITRVTRQDMWLPFVLPYWEGPIRTLGSHNAVGFMQLTGY